MKFLITWQIQQGKLHDVLGAFAQMTAEQEQEHMGPQLKLIGRWHDVVRGTGSAVYEAESAEAISSYSLLWNNDIDLDISVVLDDEETKAIGRKMASQA